VNRACRAGGGKLLTRFSGWLRPRDPAPDRLYRSPPTFGPRGLTPYRRSLRHHGDPEGPNEKASIPAKEVETQRSDSSGRPDLNRGPPAPEAGALTGLRYAPSFNQCALEDLNL
jgi:hypothetical protein